MGWKAEHNEELSILEVGFSGSPGLDELREAVQTSLKFCERHRLTRVLADCSALLSSVNSSILNTFELSSFYESMNITSAMKEAIILPEDPVAAVMMQFFETTVRNRGLNIRVFASRNLALAWLQKV